jgi:signal peptidase I
VDDADQPAPGAPLDGDFADRIADVSERADELASRVAQFSTEAHAPATDGGPAAEATSSGLRRFGAWLFERRPVPGAEPEAALPAETAAHSAPAPISRALDALDQQAPTVAERQQLPVDQERDREERPEEKPGDEPAGEPEGAAAEKARPRPYAGAPVVIEKPATNPESKPDTKPESKPATPRDPIADFFSRTDEDDKRRWLRRRPKDERDDDRPEKPAKDVEPRDHKPLPKSVRKLVRLTVVVAIAIAAALLLRSYVVEPYYVPSQSMEPTLHGCAGCDDDHVLVEKLSYLFHDPQPGDIVVFNRPSTWRVPDKVLIKRVIGVPGDVIKLQNGKVYRDNVQLDEPYVNQKCRHGTVPKDGSERRKLYPKVPNGDVFVMGDNRCDSEDSRYFGVVPQSTIIGRAFVIIWPLHRIHSLS